MKTKKVHITYAPFILFLLLVGSWDVKGQTTSNPMGFENSLLGDWVGGTATETVALNSVTVRTGTKSMALTTTSNSTNRYWYGHTPYGASSVGTYVHFIYWAKASAASTSVDASMRYATSAPPTGTGSTANSTGAAISTTLWTQIKFNAGNSANRWYFPSPRKTSGTATTFYIDDIIIYTSNSNTTDIVSPISANGSTGDDLDGIRWTNGSDTGTGATGIQATLLFKRTAGINGSNDLSLNNQAIYSLNILEGPSVVGNWTLVTNEISASATSYNSGVFVSNEEYAVVHRDLAYNYSTPSYVVITHNGRPALTTEAISNIMAATATGNATITNIGDGITISGICWNTSGTPSIGDNKTTDGPSTAITYTGELTSLSANTLYYVRAYATGIAGTGYGAQVSFTTLPNEPNIGIANNISATNFTANWEAPAVQGSEVFTYEVEVTSNSGDYSSPVANITGISSASLSTLVSGLNAETEYFYRVRTTNAGGYSAWSSESSGVFTLVQRTLTINISPSLSGTVTANSIPLISGIGTGFGLNEDVTLVASPAAGFGFLRWITGGTNRTSDNPYDISMAEDISITAQFAASTCSSYNFDGLTTTDLSSSADVTDDFISNGGEWRVLTSRLNTTSTYSHSTNNSIRLYYDNGSIITPIAARPVSISYWARMYNTAYASTLKIHISTDGGTTYNPTPLSSHAVSGAAWQQFSTTISSSSANVRIKIENASGQTSTNYNVVIDDIQFCLGPETTPPSLTFIPSNLSAGILVSNNLTITSNEKLYRYVTTSGALLALNVGDLAFTNTDTLATFLSLKKISDNSDVPFTVNIDATGKILTIDPSSSLGYSTEYRLSIRNVGDSYANLLASTQYSQFTTQTLPAPIISIKEVSSSTVNTNGSTYNFGTTYGGTTISKTFRIYNLGDGPLTITSSNLTTGVKYAKTTSPNATINAGDSSSFTIQFTPVSTGVYTDVISIVNNDLSNPNFSINLTGGKAEFVLPYKYQSGCTNPVMSSTELTHDYTALSDIPAEITLKNGAALDNTHFFNSYKVFQSEGNCMPYGSSALRVGQGVSALHIALPNCGEVKLKWCSNGYRKVKISDLSGNTYEQSPSYLPSCICYSTNTVVNTPNPITISIEFLGNDTALLTTLYYLEITPYSTSYQSSGRNILNFSTGIAGESVHIYNDIILATVPAGTDLSSISPTLIQTSPFASVSPAQGITKDFTGAVFYTVTAQNGLTKTYSVSIEHEVLYTAPAYSDSIIITVDMNESDKKLEVVEIANSACKVPISGNGSNYTINFLSEEDMPVEGYTIDGLRELCIGSIATYSISNPPTTNFPKYTWHLTGPDKDLFTIIGDTVSEKLRLKAPDELIRTNLSFSVVVEFEPCNCMFLRGEDTIAVNIIYQDPDPITGLDANCVVNGLLTVIANGSINATSYNWDFTPDVPIVSQNQNTIVLNIGNNTYDISATVNTQNGCGITFDPTAWDIPYAMPESRWTGSIDTDWDKNENWTARVPKACTDVIIPDVGGGVEYPIINPRGECHNITFEPGAGVLGLQKLSYYRAYIQTELQREKWYTITSPLKNMYAADYAFEGRPVTTLRLFDQINPDSLYSGGVQNIGTWTRGFSSGDVVLTPGMGWAYSIDTKTYDYPNPIKYLTENKFNYFPREFSPSVLMDSSRLYSTYSGRFLGSVDLPRDSTIAYRFAMENNNNQLQNCKIPIKPGLNLIGNPLMCHLDFVALLASNAGVISNKIKFWNGTTFTTFMSGSDIYSNLDSTTTSIAPMQAFFVEGLTTDTLEIDLNTHFKIDYATKLRNTNVSSNVLHIKTNNGSKQSSAAIAMRTNSSNNCGEDDAFKLFSQYSDVPEVYTTADEVALDINQFSHLPYMIPIGLNSTKTGSIIFTFDGAESFDNIDVTLLNTRTGEQQNIKQNNQYILNFDGVNTDGYLFIEFRSASETTETNEAKNEVCEGNKCIQVYQKSKDVIGIISPSNDKIKNISIWEQSGILLFSKYNINRSTIDTKIQAPNQTCVVRVTTENKTYVVKLIMKQ